MKEPISGKKTPDHLLKTVHVLNTATEILLSIKSELNASKFHFKIASPIMLEKIWKRGLILVEVDVTRIFKCFFDDFPDVEIILSPDHFTSRNDVSRYEYPINGTDSTLKCYSEDDVLKKVITLLQECNSLKDNQKISVEVDDSESERAEERKIMVATYMAVNVLLNMGIVNSRDWASLFIPLTLHKEYFKRSFEKSNMICCSLCGEKMIGSREEKIPEKKSRRFDGMHKKIGFVDCCILTNGFVKKLEDVVFFYQLIAHEEKIKESSKIKKRSTKKMRRKARKSLMIQNLFCKQCEKKCNSIEKLLLETKTSGSTNLKKEENTTIADHFIEMQKLRSSIIEKNYKELLMDVSMNDETFLIMWYEEFFSEKFLLDSQKLLKDDLLEKIDDKIVRQYVMLLCFRAIYFNPDIFMQSIVGDGVQMLQKDRFAGHISSLRNEIFHESVEKSTFNIFTINLTPLEDTSMRSNGVKGVHPSFANFCSLSNLDYSPCGVFLLTGFAGKCWIIMKENVKMDVMRKVVPELLHELFLKHQLDNQ